MNFDSIQLDKNRAQSSRGEVFRELVRRQHAHKRVICVDSQSGQTDSQLIQVEGREIPLWIFPKGTTKFAQSLGVHCSKQEEGLCKTSDRSVRVPQLQNRLAEGRSQISVVLLRLAPTSFSEPRGSATAVERASARPV